MNMRVLMDYILLHGSILKCLWATRARHSQNPSVRVIKSTPRCNDSLVTVKRLSASCRLTEMELHSCNHSLCVRRDTRPLDTVAHEKKMSYKSIKHLTEAHWEYMLLIAGSFLPWKLFIESELWHMLSLSKRQDFLFAWKMGVFGKPVQKSHNSQTITWCAINHSEYRSNPLATTQNTLAMK